MDRTRSARSVPLAEFGLVPKGEPLAMSFPRGARVARQVLLQKCSYSDRLCENTRIQAASKLQARRDLLGINGRSQTVINIRNLSPIRDSTARTTKKQDGSDDLGENASVRQVARSEVIHDECRQQQGL
jgi:hypothetical protein